MYHCHHRGQQRNHLPVSEAVGGSAEGKCGLILRHFPTRLVSRCGHLHLLIISNHAPLCWWELINDNHTNNPLPRWRLFTKQPSTKAWTECTFANPLHWNLWARWMMRLAVFWPISDGKSQLSLATTGAAPFSSSSCQF